MQGMRLERPRRAIAAAAFTLALLCGGVHAASLQVAPTMLTLQATQNADGLWLSNSGVEPVTVQLRVFRWTQAGGGESLDETGDLVASPPMQTLPPGQKQLVRIVRTASVPLPTEQAYRVIVDELPRPTDKPGLQFVLRYSIPVFIDPPPTGQVLAPALSARLDTGADGIATLEVANRGSMHAQLADLEFQPAGAAAPRSVLDGLVGYVLPGQTMRWPLKGPASQFASGVLRARINSASDKTPLLPVGAR